MNIKFFEKNIELLKKKHPLLAQKVIACSPTHSEFVKTPSGDIDLIFQGQRLYGDMLPQTVEKTFSEANLQSPKIIAFYGIGLGYALEKFFRISNECTQDILIVEKYVEVFRRALEVSDWEKILCDPRVTFMVGVESEKEIQHFIFDYIRDVNRLVVIQTLGALIEYGSLAVNGEYFLKVAQIIKTTADSMQEGFAAHPEDAYRGHINIFDNLDSCKNVPSFEVVEGMFEGLLGISVSTGPSLKHSIDWLKKVQNRAVIACADSALRILLQNGITPHLVGCIERVPETKLLFENLPPLPETWLVSTPVIWPETYQNYPGPKINMMREICQLKWYFPEAKYFDTGSSASHVAMMSLVHLGCSEIMLVGQDLAYDRHSVRSHMDGVPQLIYDDGQVRRREAEEKAKQGDSEVMVEGNDGSPILTMEWYSKFRKVFNTFIRYSGIPCYNVIPKNYGAKIEEAIWKDPVEVLSFLEGRKTVPIANKISEKISSYLKNNGLKNDGENKKGNSSEFFKKRHLEALSRLEEISSASLEVLDSTSIFQQKYSPRLYGSETYLPFFKKTQKIAETLVGGKNDFYESFILAVTQTIIFPLAQHSEKILAKEKISPELIEEQLEIIRSWFSVNHYWAERLKHHLLKVMKK